jgi:hypothetical protein
MKKILSLLKYFINLFWGVIFLLFASVQFNDPDPMTWILVYTLTAILCFLYLNTKTAQKIRWVYVLTAVGLLMGSYNQFPPQWEGFGTSMKTENNELARESIGLLLCGLVLLTQSVFLFGDINKQR